MVKANTIIVPLGHVLYLVLTTAAMLIYPGGYVFSANFMSDLGLIEYGYLGPGLFLLGLSAMACAQTLYYQVETPRFIQGRLLTLIRAAGWVCVIGIVLVGLTPYNRFPVAHMVAVAMWLVGLAIVMLCHAWFFIAQRITLAAIGTLVLIGLIFAHSIQALFFTSSPLLQKVLIYYMVLWFLYFPQAGCANIEHVAVRTQSE